MRKEPVFYCQLDYENIPYPSPKDGFGNIANNGCGPCSVSMLIENMLGLPFPPDQSAAFALECGARADVGTNLYILARAVAERFSLTVTDTEDGDAAQAFLLAGHGMVIANTQGDRPADGYFGTFSDSGHYILLTGAEGNDVRVLDPMYRPGRYDTPHRKGKVRMDGNTAIAAFDIVKGDCKDRPYFLFARPDANA